MLYEVITKDVYGQNILVGIFAQLCVLNDQIFPMNDKPFLLPGPFEEPGFNDLVVRKVEGDGDHDKQKENNPDALSAFHDR